MEYDEKNPSASYPIKSFPPVLENVITTLHEDTGFPAEMIGSTLLAAAALSLQPLVEITYPYRGRPISCSLYMMILAKSGKGKSPVRDLIMKPFDDFADEMDDEFQGRHAQYLRDHHIWKLELKNLEKSLKRERNKSEIKESINKHLEEEPNQPQRMSVFIDDATPASLIKDLGIYPCSGLILDEAITFFKGHLKQNIGLLNKSWNSEGYDLNRVGNGDASVKMRINPYLTILLMIQPDVFDEYIEVSGKIADGSGFLPRFMYTCIDELTEFGDNKNRTGASDQALDMLSEKIGEWLKKQKENFYIFTSKEGGRNATTKQAMYLSDAAISCWEAECKELNKYTTPGEEAEHISEHITKAEINILKVAAIIKKFNNPEAEIIDCREISDASNIVTWHLNQASSLFDYKSPKKKFMSDVYTLFDWIKNRFENPNGTSDLINSATGGITKRAIMQYEPFKKREIGQRGPKSLRNIDVHNPLIDELISLGLIVQFSYPRGPIMIGIPHYNGVANDFNIYKIDKSFASPQSIKVKYNSPPSKYDDYDKNKLNWELDKC
ncbi:TPA: DUF3987 domain-containing protein [Salmonella enterica]